MSRFLGILLVIFFIPYYCLAASGQANTYQVTMRQVELCQDTGCSNSVVVGNGSQSVDIASLTAGAEAAKFASTSGLPIGTTFTHLKVTINRSFTLSGTVTVGSTTCTTDGNAAGTATALHTGTRGDTSGLTDTTLYLANAQSYGSDNSINIDYNSPTYARSMVVGSPDSSQAELIYDLSKPYTVGLTAPKIKVTFNTSTALGAGIDGGNNCLMWPEEPYVSISIVD